MTPPLPRTRLLGYGVGSVGTGVFSALPGLLLLYYLTDVLGVAAGLAGLVLVLPKVWDMLVDPVIGVASDREAVRTGHRTRLMLTGALTLPVLFAAMFAAPALAPVWSAVWVGCAFTLATTAFNLFQVPYVALPAEISPRRDQRARAMSWRVVCLTLGVLAAGGLAPAVVESAGGGRAGHLVMGAAIGLVLGAALVASTAGTRWIIGRPGPRTLGPVAALRAARGNKAFFRLALAFALQALAVSVMLAAAPYVAVYRLDDYGLTSAMFVCVVGPSLVAVPAWSAAARRFGTVRCYLAAVAAMTASALLLLPAVLSERVVPVLAATGLVGLCYAGLQLLPLSLLPETVREDAGRSGQAQAGTFTGMWTGLETGAMALGPGLFAAVLGLTAFRSAEASVAVAQPAGALAGIGAGFTLLPAALFLASLPPLLAFRRGNPGDHPLGRTGPAPETEPGHEPDTDPGDRSAT
ncbi:Na+/melibiose symporter-like transporter [Nocardiopsis arvandica]|uniref:Na+/melibiose symporter-like transporter n=1 Tax=Nocardiopsis sinuspersici TaxID=501010 RepID=A0A7Y9XEY8_9ACTN|nr:Na+/melibiose symporter-like transporter [Nocardiopsis sinuspersici]